jgi:hypothetical protein
MEKEILRLASKLDVQVSLCESATNDLMWHTGLSKNQISDSSPSRLFGF